MPAHPHFNRIIYPAAPDRAAIHEAADIVGNGGIVVFPTRNLYGLGADAFNPDAVARLFRIKRRPPEKPVSILVASRLVAERLVTDIPAVALKLMDRFWPGRLTIVLAARPDVPPALTAGTGKIGIRVPEHPAAAALLAALGRPVTGTSANWSGRPGVHRISDLPEAFLKDVDLILDAGELKTGIGSTVVDVTAQPPVVLREGEVRRQELAGMF